MQPEKPRGRLVAKSGAGRGHPLRSLGLGCIFFLSVAASSPAHALVWPDVAEHVEKDLGAADPTTRRNAARALVELGPGRGAPLALEALGDADDEVKLAAAETAIRLHATGATDAVLKWLNLAGGSPASESMRCRPSSSLSARRGATRARPRGSRPRSPRRGGRCARAPGNGRRHTAPSRPPRRPGAAGSHSDRRCPRTPGGCARSSAADWQGAGLLTRCSRSGGTRAG